MCPAASVELEPPSVSAVSSSRRVSVETCALPSRVEAAVWRGNQLGHAVAPTLATGFAALDAELPGQGWPCRGLTEVLAAQFAFLEWRLTSVALRAVSDQGRDIVLVGPPHRPHPPGLLCAGIEPRRLLWVDADKPQERLWATEQAIKSNACGAVLTWLPQVRAEQVRRLQVLALGCDAPVFVFRPALVAGESSAAPLRLQVRVSEDWELCVRILKRRGPSCDAELRLASVPGGLMAIMTERLRYPSRLSLRVPDVVVRTSTRGLERDFIPH